MSVTFIQMGMLWQTPLFLHCSVTLFCAGLITFQKPDPSDLRKCNNIVTWWNPFWALFFVGFFLQGDDVVWEALKQCWWPDAATSSQKAALPCVSCHCYTVDHWMDHDCRELPAMPLLPTLSSSWHANLEVKSNIWAIKPLCLVVSQLIAAHCPTVGRYFLHTKDSWQSSAFLRPQNISKWLCLGVALLKSSEITCRLQFCLYAYSVTYQTLQL